MHVAVKDVRNYLFLTNADLNNERLSLGRQERLKSKKAIASLFSEGSYFVSGPLQAVVCKRKDKEPPIRIAVSVPKRNLKKAVDRNKVKRRIREAYRLAKPQWFSWAKNQPFDMLFIYRSKAVLPYASIEKHIGRLEQNIQSKLKS